MIKICYLAPHGLDISGDVDELQTISRALLDLSTSPGRELELSADIAFDPSPYKVALPKLLIHSSHGPTQIAVTDDLLVQISGSPDNLRRLASFFSFKTDDSKGSHHHYEYFDGNPYIAPDAIPLLVSLT